MPVKYRASNALKPAWVWALMVGQPPPCRLPGWVTFEQSAVRTPDGFDWTAPADVLWAQHRLALMAEGRAHHFVPYWHTKQAPTGRGFEEWRDRFLATHRY
jgi:hypothetical protein